MCLTTRRTNGRALDTPDEDFFSIKPLTMDEGFELDCEGIMEKSLRVERLFEAVVLATTLGQRLNFEIQIFDVDGQKAEIIELQREPVLAD